MTHFQNDIFIWNYRKRREVGRDNLSQIKAEMETVYNVQGKGEAGNDLSSLNFPEMIFFISFLFYFVHNFKFLVRSGRSGKVFSEHFS